MSPEVQSGEFFCTVDKSYAELNPVALFMEAEGPTLLVPVQMLMLKD